MNAGANIINIPAKVVINPTICATIGFALNNSDIHPVIAVTTFNTICAIGAMAVAKLTTIITMFPIKLTTVGPLVWI